MLQNNTTSRSQYPLVTYGVVSPGDGDTRPVSNECLGADRRRPVAAAGAISIVTLTLTVSGLHFGDSGFAAAEQRSAVSYTVEASKMMAGSLAFEALPLGASIDHQLLSYSADEPNPSGPPSGRLTAIRNEINFKENFDKLNPKNSNNFKYIADVKKEKSEIQAIQAHSDVSVADNSLMEGVDFGFPANERDEFLVGNVDLKYSSKLLVRNAEIIERQGVLLDDNMAGKLTEAASHLLPSLSHSEFSAINPVDPVRGDTDAEFGETERETTAHDLVSGHGEAQSFPAEQELAGSALVLASPAVSAPRKARKHAGAAQREIGVAIANLKIRVGDQPASGLSPSEAHKLSEEAAGSVSAQFQHAISSRGENISPLAVTVSDGQLVSVRLDEIISLFEKEMDKPLFVWLKKSPNANKFVTPELLLRSGIAVDYDDATKQLILSIAN